MPILDPLAPFRLDGRVALVTGASSGLGMRFARVLDGAGARVVVAARRADRIEQLAGELSDALAVPCDLADRDAPAALVEAVIGHYGQIDVLVNNAGFGRAEPALEQSIDDFRREIDINLIAPFALSALAARAMIDRGLAAARS